jgi:hypothetical protein
VAAEVGIVTEKIGHTNHNRAGSLPPSTVVTATLRIEAPTPTAPEIVKDYACLSQIADRVEEATGWPVWAKAVRRIGEPVTFERSATLLWWAIAAVGGLVSTACGWWGARGAA